MLIKENGTNITSNSDSRVLQTLYLHFSKALDESSPGLSPTVYSTKTYCVLQFLVDIFSSYAGMTLLIVRVKVSFLASPTTSDNI